jgi:hypothetical protein
MMINAIPEDWRSIGCSSMAKLANTVALPNKSKVISPKIIASPGACRQI